MLRFVDGFTELLKGFNLETLEHDPNSVFGLSSDLTINYLNPAWFTFAEQNDGQPGISSRFTIGTPLGDCMTEVVRDFYLEAFQRVLETGQVWHHDYECSSPDTFRVFHQSVYPLHNRTGLVSVNSLVTEQAHDPLTRVAHLPAERNYVQETGHITQCCNCRRVQRAAERQVWDWVPAWVKHMPDNTSHTFCQICFEYYYESKYPSKS